MLFYAAKRWQQFITITLWIWLIHMQQLNHDHVHSKRYTFFSPHLSSYSTMKLLLLKGTTLEKQHNRLFLVQISYHKCQTSAILCRHKDKTAMNAAGTEGSWYLIFVQCGFDWLPAITGENMETGNALPLEFSPDSKVKKILLEKSSSLAKALYPAS